MTLLVFAKGSDGFVIISDRKESDVMGLENDVTKYCLPKNKEFFLSLAGNGTRAESLFARLAKPDVKSINIISTIKDFIRATYAESQEIQYVDGFLAIKNEKNFKFYTICITKDEFVPSEIYSGFCKMGDSDAKLILEHLVRNINFENLPCEIVTKRLIAIIDDIAETVSSVGDREKFGFDITAFKNSGQVYNRKKYTDSGERLKISFESSDNEIFPNFKNNGVNNNE